MVPRGLIETDHQGFQEQLTLAAHIAEFAEWDSRAHVERIRRYAYILARGSGMDHDDAALISSACILHDIGKTALPARLLQNAGKLTLEEYKTAEQHAEEGFRLLNGLASPVLQAAAVICLTHHERWDGSGYPRGLEGDAIPLSGRIMALADVFDALATKRPYKAAVKPEAATDLIRSSSATLFDPALVSIFMDKLDEFLSVLHMKEEHSRV